MNDLGPWCGKKDCAWPRKIQNDRPAPDSPAPVLLLVRSDLFLTLRRSPRNESSKQSAKEQGEDLLQQKRHIFFNARQRQVSL